MPNRVCIRELFNCFYSLENKSCQFSKKLIKVWLKTFSIWKQTLMPQNLCLIAHQILLAKIVRQTNVHYSSNGKYLFLPKTFYTCQWFFQYDGYFILFDASFQKSSLSNTKKSFAFNYKFKLQTIIKTVNMSTSTHTRPRLLQMDLLYAKQYPSSFI